MKSNAVTIAGAGLCGSLLAVLLAKRGLDVIVCERNPDPRGKQAASGRSINLAMSARGIRALRHAGVLPAVEPLLMPMRGRFIHHEDGSTELQSYGQRAHELIYSVSRAELNRILVDEAIRRYGVSIEFGQAATRYDRDEAALWISDAETGREYRLDNTPLIAADGAGSVVRRAYDDGGRIKPSESMLPHSYKELAIPPGAGGGFQLESGALHIWPRGGFMLIALPNPGGDFTLTLFLPNEGEASFGAIDTPKKIEAFFAQHFADAMALIPDLVGTYQHNPVGWLGTVRCRHWHVGGEMLLIGDAAHAIVPFHGQGMNLAFEDCVVLDRVLDEGLADWARVFAAFEASQRDNANAIADMALENYVEMRDTVRDPKFVLQKALAFELEKRLPDRFIPRYSMVMFHDEIPYATAQERGQVQQSLLEEFTADAGSLEDVDIDAAAAEVEARLSAL